MFSGCIAAAGPDLVICGGGRDGVGDGVQQAGRGLLAGCEVGEEETAGGPDHAAALPPAVLQVPQLPAAAPVRLAVAAVRVRQRLGQDISEVWSSLWPALQRLLLQVGERTECAARTVARVLDVVTLGRLVNFRVKLLFRPAEQCGTVVITGGRSTWCDSTGSCRPRRS